MHVIDLEPHEYRSTTKGSAPERHKRESAGAAGGTGGSAMPRMALPLSIAHLDHRRLVETSLLPSKTSSELSQAGRLQQTDSSHGWRPLFYCPRCRATIRCGLLALVSGGPISTQTLMAIRSEPASVHSANRITASSP
jgi:hypothetical protein